MFKLFLPLSGILTALPFIILLGDSIAFAADSTAAEPPSANRMWAIHLKHEFPDYEGVAVLIGGDYLLTYRNPKADSVWCKVLSKTIRTEQLSKNKYLTVREVIRSENASCVEQYPVGTMSRILSRFITKDLYQFRFVTEKQLEEGNLDELTFDRQWYVFLCSDDITRKPGDCDAPLPEDIWPGGYPEVPFVAAKNIPAEW